ncbi:hypothetical protein PRK78_005817 [Emydomyces testavorans]|uniref:Uncharacterized protein n=1 Tax=Emydomyces testavorans TaxID=2070801 RepID=A0AAF0DKH3_9EURO|nr:hypothetical protein PRK78_005817 [Emydomyces testavorans]
MSWLYPFANSSSSSSRRRRSSHDRHSTIGSSHRSTHHHSRHSASAPSIFSLGSYANRSTTSSLYSSGGSSSRRARPRSGFVARMVHKIKRLFRDIVHYAKRHPVKVFLLVIMPLITGGVLQKLLGAVGIRVPRSLMGGGNSSRGAGGGGFESGGNGISESVNGLILLLVVSRWVGKKWEECFVLVFGRQRHEMQRDVGKARYTQVIYELLALQCLGRFDESRRASRRMKFYER